MATHHDTEGQALDAALDGYAQDLFEELRWCAKAQADADWTVFLVRCRRSLEIVVRMLMARHQGKPLPDEAQGSDRTLDAWIRQLADGGVLSQTMRDSCLILKGRGAIGAHYRGRAAGDERVAAQSARLELRNVVVFLVERSPVAGLLGPRKVALFELLELMEQQASPRSLRASFPTQLAAQGQPSALTPPATTLDPVPAALEDTASEPVLPATLAAARTVFDPGPAAAVEVEEEAVPDALVEEEDADEHEHADEAAESPEPTPPRSARPPRRRRWRLGRLLVAAMALLALAGAGSVLGVGGALAFLGLRGTGAGDAAEGLAQLGPGSGAAAEGADEPDPDGVREPARGEAPGAVAETDIVPRIAPESELSVPLGCPAPEMVLVPETTLYLEVPPRLRRGGGVKDFAVAAFCVDAEPVGRTAYRAWVEEQVSIVEDPTVCTWEGTAMARDAVRCVAWEDAKSFCQERGARLPRLAEWEAFQRQPEGAQAVSGTHREWAHEADLYEAFAVEDARPGRPTGGLSLARSSETFRPPDDSDLQWAWSAQAADRVDTTLGFRCAADPVPVRSARAR